MMMARPGKKIFDKVRNFIERNSLIKGSKGVVVTVSGGPDSIALLDILVRIRSASKRGQAQPFGLHVVHLDHQLRGDHSRLDADFVRSRAEFLGLPSTIQSIDVAAAARASKRGVEEVAREIRYWLFLRVAAEREFDRIATGHTMNDQAETLLMRLIRGSGGRGLASMRPAMPAHEFRNDSNRPAARLADWDAKSGRLSARTGDPYVCTLIRPLLCITREEVEEYCKARELEFRLDASNDTRDYLRNRVRHDVLPVLSQLNPRAIRSIARAAGILATEEDAIDDRIRSLVEAARVPSKGQYRDEARYAARQFIDQPEAIRRRMIISAISRVPGRKRVARQTSAAHVSAVDELLTAGKSGKRVEVGHGVQAWLEFGELVIVNRNLREANKLSPSGIAELSEQRATALFGDILFEMERGQSVALRGPSMEKASEHNKAMQKNWMMVLLDEESLPGKLAIRVRRPGEEAHVVGQRGTKKLKNLMIDHKIPSSRRATWPIVATPDGGYVWSPGLPPRIEFALRDQTKRFAVLRGYFDSLFPKGEVSRSPNA
jgi:tRNA(Ile)-lysidine synthetase-like protein